MIGAVIGFILWALLALIYLSTKRMTGVPLDVTRVILCFVALTGLGASIDYLI